MTDPLTRRILSELSDFTDWLERFGVEGYIGEVGWPDDAMGDAARWNALAERWYRAADQAQLWVTAWATGEWWHTGYKLADYEERTAGHGVDSADTQAAVIERHLDANGYRRGINDAGGEFTAPELQATSEFSNENPGAYDVQYHYDSQATFDYLARRGLSLVRIPFRWERLQPALFGPLDGAELTRLRGVVTRAGNAGLSVILDLHNYGAYYEASGGRGVRRALGDPGVIRAFVDVWRRISSRFAGNPAVIGYDLMNEPIGLPSVGGLSPPEVWRTASQLAVSAIRDTGDRTLVLVSGYGHSGAQDWSAVNPVPWIRDPVDRVRYEAHHYWDRDHSGNYAFTYAQEVEDAKERGF